MTGRLRAGRPTAIDWTAAVDAFLTAHELAPTTRRVYRSTLVRTLPNPYSRS